MAFLQKSGSNFSLNGSRYRGIGFNYYPALVDTTAQSTMQSLYDANRARGGMLMRHWCFSRGKPPTDSNGNLFYESGGSLITREATLVHLDMILNEASKRGQKLVLSLADNTTNYDTKATYVSWANDTMAAGLSEVYPYVGFFDAAACRDIFENNFGILANRVNTINGKTYKNDDAIAWWELGNELRYDVFDAEGGTQNTINSTNIAKVMDWTDDLAGRMKAIDPNHLVSFSSVSHTWQWVEGDTVSNGSGYGADYILFGDLVNVDILDFHNYPTQGGGEINLLKYGQRLGYPNQINGLGYRAQLRDFPTQIKAKGKICVCGELGFIREAIASTVHFPLYPRHEAIKAIIDELVAADIDAVLLWSATITGGGSYSIGLAETGNGNFSGSNANSNDATLMHYINRMNKKLINSAYRPRVM